MTDGETMEATTAPAPQQTGQDKFPTWKIAGHKAADEVSTTVAQKLGTVTQLFSNAIADSNFLRAAFGNLWFIMPIVGVVIGIAAIKNTGGAMLPPSTGLFIALVVIGIIDSVAGLLAFLVFSVVSAVSGNGIQELLFGIQRELREMAEQSNSAQQSPVLPDDEDIRN